MKLKRNPFAHLHTDNQDKERDTSTFVKKITVLFFVLFLFLLRHYAPWETGFAQHEGWTFRIFSLYFFVLNQTLGIVHEGGHGVCYLLPCPEFVMVANGTVFQLLFPGLIAYYYHVKNNRFAMLIGLYFLGFSLQYTAWYLSTSHEGPILPAHKSFLGVDAYHDFHYMLSATGLLAYESLISGVLRLIANILMFASVIGMFLDAFSSKTKNKKPNSF